MRRIQMRVRSSLGKATAVLLASTLVALATSATATATPSQTPEPAPTPASSPAPTVSLPSATVSPTPSPSTAPTPSISPTTVPKTPAKEQASKPAASPLVQKQATLVLNKKVISYKELMTVGILTTASNFPPNARLTVLIDSADVDGRGVLADANGFFSSHLIPLNSLIPGNHTITISDLSQAHTASATFQLTSADAPQVSLDQSWISTEDLARTGIKISGTNFPRNKPVFIGLPSANKTFGSPVADAEGNFSYQLITSLEPTPYLITFGSAPYSTTAQLTVTPAHRSNVSPQRTSATDLAALGVTVSTTSLPAGTKVDLYLDQAFIGSYRTDTSGSLSINLKRSGVAVGWHALQLRWPAQEENTTPLPINRYGTSTVSFEVVPGGQVISSGTGELANTGISAVPLVLGLLTMMSGIGLLLLSRRRKTVKATC